MKNTATLLMVALFQVLVGGILAGCEGGDATDGVLGVNKSGGNVCTDASIFTIKVSGTWTSDVNGKEIPAPEYVQRLCVGWSAADGYDNEADCVKDLSKLIMTQSQIESYCQSSPQPSTCVKTTTYSVMTKSQVDIECSTKMTQAECSDVEHGYEDSAGKKHMLKTVSGHVSGFYFMSDCGGVGTTPVCSGDVYIGEGCSN